MLGCERFGETGGARLSGDNERWWLSRKHLCLALAAAVNILSSLSGRAPIVDFIWLWVRGCDVNVMVLSIST